MVPARCWEAFTGESLFSAGRSSPAASMNCDPTIEARRQRNRRFGDFRFCDAKRFAHARSSHIRIAGFRPWRTIGDMHRWKMPVPEEQSRFRYFLGTRELSERSDHCNTFPTRLLLWGRSFPAISTQPGVAGPWVASPGTATEWAQGQPQRNGRLDHLSH